MMSKLTYKKDQIDEDIFVVGIFCEGDPDENRYYLERCELSDPRHKRIRIPRNIYDKLLGMEE